MSPAQQEQLLTIGTYLQSIRKDQGKTVDEVANQIYIRPALVRAIEAGDWQTLPEPVFVQGFIRRYAEYLGLDGQEIAQQFKPTPVSVLPDPKLASDGGVEGVVSKQAKHGLKVLSKADPQDSSGGTPRHRRQRIRPWLIGTATIAVILAGGLWLGTRDRSPVAPEIEQTSPSEAPTSPPPAEESANAASSEAAEGPPADPSAAPIQFQVTLQGDSWMRIIADGEEVYEGILTQGTEQSWTAQTELRVTAGNSGVVLYSFNGSDPTPMGDPGAVSRLTLTPSTNPQAL